MTPQEIEDQEAFDAWVRRVGESYGNMCIHMANDAFLAGINFGRNKVIYKTKRANKRIIKMIKSNTRLLSK